MVKNRTPWWIFKITLLVSLIGVAAWKYDLRVMTSTFSWNIVIAILLVQPISLASQVAAGLRLQGLIKTPHLSTIVSFKAVLLCNGVNVLLPGRISELLKATYIRDKANAPLATGFAAIFLERMTDVLMLGFFAIVGLGMFALNVNWMLPVTAIILIGGITLIPHLTQPIIRLVNRLPWASLRSFFERFFNNIEAHIKDRSFYRALALAVLVWFLSYLQIATFLYVSESVSIGLSGALVVFVASAVGGAIPVLPGGFGTYEAAVVFALSKYGYPVEVALPIALSMHISQLLLSVAGGLLICALEQVGVFRLAKDIYDERKTERQG